MLGSKLVLLRLNFTLVFCISKGRSVESDFSKMGTNKPLLMLALCRALCAGESCSLGSDL